MQQIRNPVPLFLDASGALSSGGYIYVGVADADPRSEPIDVFWDFEGTIPAEQPLRTIGGYVVNGTQPASFFCAEADYSMRQEDYNQTLVDYSPSVFTDSSSFQPASDTLTELAETDPTPFGLSLLELANSAALATATGIPAPLPLVGGTMSGNIVRSGAGVHAYWFDPAMTGARIFLTAEGDPDPTSLPGDIWLTYS